MRRQTTRACVSLQRANAVSAVAPSNDRPTTRLCTARGVDTDSSSSRSLRPEARVAPEPEENGRLCSASTQLSAGQPLLVLRAGPALHTGFQMDISWSLLNTNREEEPTLVVSPQMEEVVLHPSVARIQLRAISHTQQGAAGGASSWSPEQEQPGPSRQTNVAAQTNASCSTCVSQETLPIRIRSRSQTRTSSAARRTSARSCTGRVTRQTRSARSASNDRAQSFVANGRRTRASPPALALQSSSRRNMRSTTVSIPSDQIANTSGNKTAAIRRKKIIAPVVSSKMLLRAAAKRMPVACRYSASGCKEMMVSAELEKHAAVCEFRPYHCPLASEHCHWRGELGEIVNHLVEYHPDIECQRGPNTKFTITNVRRAAPMEWITIQTCLGQNFLVMLQKLVRNGHAQFFGTIKIFGSSEDADRFEFSMTLRKPDRVLSYSTLVRTLRSGNAAVTERDCLVFDASYADLFLSNGNLVIEVSISLVKN